MVYISERSTLARSIASPSANPWVFCAAILFLSSPSFHTQKKTEMGGGEGLPRATVRCQKLAEMGGGRGVRVRIDSFWCINYIVSCSFRCVFGISISEYSPNTRRNNYVKIELMHQNESMRTLRGEGLVTRYAVSYQKVAEMGRGEKLPWAVKKWRKLGEERGSRDMP